MYLVSRFAITADSAMPNKIHINSTSDDAVANVHSDGLGLEQGARASKRHSVGRTTSDYELPEMAAHRLINAAQLRELLPVSTTTIWRLEKKGRFPQHATILGRNYWNFIAVIDAINRLTNETEDG